MYKEIGKLVQKCRRLLVFTGAGIGVPSHIPVFNGPDGLWARTALKQADPTSLITRSAFDQHPEALNRWTREYREMVAATAPNAAHKAVLRLQEYCKKCGKECLLVTQNIDGFHARLARESKVLNLRWETKEGGRGFGFTEGVLEIHGNLNYMRCSDDCCSPFLYSADSKPGKVGPICSTCGLPMRPHMLLLDEYYCEEFYRSSSAIDKALRSDCMIVIGSSLRTQLSNSLVLESVDDGKPTIEINPAKAIKYYDKNVFHVGESCEKSVPALVDAICSAAI